MYASLMKPISQDIAAGSRDGVLTERDRTRLRLSFVNPSLSSMALLWTNQTPTCRLRISTSFCIYCVVDELHPRDSCISLFLWCRQNTACTHLHGIPLAGCSTGCLFDMFLERWKRMNVKKWYTLALCSKTPVRLTKHISRLYSTDGVVYSFSKS